ncbi:MAG: hypothetical protein HYZ28_20750 [Myxococcales bacterium]|nr:hypothetical protein [Myxococcales bacterium]
MGQISDLARTLLRGGIGVRDARTLIEKAKVDGVTDAEKAELRSLLTSPDFADKFTVKGRQTLEAFLGSAPPPPPTGTPKPVRELTPSLSEVTEPKTLPNRFKADYQAVQAELVGHASLSENDKANRTFEFFQAYASRFQTLTSGMDEGDRAKAAKEFGETLRSLNFGSMVNADNDKDGVAAGVELMLGDSPDAYTVRANHKPWTTTYWPMAGSMNDPNGSPSSNLWAKDGALDKFDKLLKAKGKEEGALKFERTPSLNWLVNKESGQYIPDSMLSEKDAERTTGVDFNKNGKIDANVEWDFLDGYGQFGTDGKKDGTMSVGWWGSCDKVALAGNLFKEPKKDVTLNGVTFTAQDIKGLLTVIADSQSPQSKWAGNRYDARPDTIRLKNGSSVTGKLETQVEMYQEGMRRAGEDWVELTKNFPPEVKIRTNSGEVKTLKAEDIAVLRREDRKDDPALFHTTIREWLKTGMPAVMDKDSGDHVWNYNFWKVEDKEATTKPDWASGKLVGFNGPAGDGKITYVDREVELGGGGSTVNYQYWLEEKNGKVVNSGWAPYSSNPDFLWGPAREATFTGYNERNPFVDPALVKELYLKSIE